MVDLLSLIRRDGVALIADALPSQADFDLLYAAFDRVESLIALEPSVEQTLEQASIAWKADLSRAVYYSRAPKGFRDRSQRTDKMKKAYFQYTDGFHQFFQGRYSTILVRYPEIDSFLKLCRRYCLIAGDLLHQAVLEYDRSYPGLRRALERPGRDRPVLLRIIRYEPGSEFGTTPHRDKSAFTIHMNSDDGGAGRFVIGPGARENLSLADLRPLSRREGGDRTDAAIFPGMFLQEIGYPEIPASPHAALGMQNQRVRHSVVGFWLVPSLFTDHIETDVRFRSAA